jgi:transposase InsO family protein
VCADGLVRRCIPAFETWTVLEHCHSSPYGGHYGAFHTNAKVWQSGFYWPTMYDDAKSFVRCYSRCQKHGNFNKREAMPLTSNLQIDIFDVWGIDFMGPFPNLEGCEYILVAIDYVSKWVEAFPYRTADAMHSKRMFHEVIFPSYGIPWIVISDGGSHFIDRTFRKALIEVGVDHRIASPYHPKTSGQTETSNKQIKNILQKAVNQMAKARRASSVKLHGHTERPTKCWST